MLPLLKMGHGCLLLVLLLFVSRIRAQEYPSGRYLLTLTSDNDNYTLQKHDRYYSNGLMIRLSGTTDPGASASPYKKIWTAELGHKIFTPYYIGRNYLSTLDRPYTGFLFAKGALTTVLPGEDVFRWEVMTGVAGKAAGGQQVQESYHKRLNLVQPRGWETGLETEWGLNAQAVWYRHLGRPATKKPFDAFFQAAAQAGSFFTNFSGGFLLRLGALKGADESAWWDAQPGYGSKKAGSRPYELFFYYEPSVTYQVYNATVQGGLFSGKENSFTADIQPFYYRHNFGAMFTQKQWTMQLGFTYKTKEARSMITSENYGTLALGYRF